MVIRYRGTPPSLAVAKGSAHTRCSVLLCWWRRWWWWRVVAHERRRSSNLRIMPLSATICSFNKIFSRVRYLFCIRANSIILKASISVGEEDCDEVEGCLLLLLPELDPPWPSWSYHPCWSPRVLLSSALSSLAKHRCLHCWRRVTTWCLALTTLTENSSKQKQRIFAWYGGQNLREII